MNKCFTLLLIALLYGMSCFAQMPDSVRAYIDTALYYMQTKSLNSNKVNWMATKDSAYKKAAHAVNYKEAFPALVYAFQQLKDYHGMVANEDTFYRYPPPFDVEKLVSPGVKKEFLKGNRFVTSYLNNAVGYLRVPSMNVNDQASIDALANRLRDSLCMLVSKQPKGLIIDLRMNGGGNSVPMQSGLGPLFTNSLLGYGVDKDGKFLEPIKLKDGIVIDEAGNKMTSIKNTCLVDKDMPVAILVGGSTASSAEILTVFLRQQPNVKVFGEPTAGFCNATEGFLFMNNQGYLLLSVNLIADAKKKVYKEWRLQPDILVKNNDNFEQLEKDLTVTAALLWLKAKAK